MTASGQQRGSWTLDLYCVIVLTVLAGVAIALDLAGGGLRAVLTVPLAILLPGYALVSALLPGTDRPKGKTDGSDRSIGFVERLLLGVLASAAVVPGIAYVFAFTPYGITPRPVAAGVGGVTLLLCGIAMLRRRVLPADARFRVPTGAIGVIPQYVQAPSSASTADRPLVPRTRTHAAFNLLLVVSVLVLLGSVGFALVSPPSDESFTEFYLLTEDEEGELVASGYPASFDEAAAEPLYLAIENHEDSSMEYTVVVQQQTVNDDEGDTTVTASREVDRFSLRVASSETEQPRYEFEGEEPGDDTHLAFLLYKDDPPASPAAENAYRSVALDMSS